MTARWPRCQKVCSSGEELVANRHYARKDIKLRCDSLYDKWKKLRDLAAARKTRLDDAYESHQVIFLHFSYSFSGFVLDL